MITKVFKNPNNGKYYRFELENGVFTIINVTDDRRRVLRVIPSEKYVVKANKNSVSAIGGARGLFDFLNANVDISDLFACYKFALIREFPI